MNEFEREPSEDEREAAIETEVVETEDGEQPDTEEATESEGEESQADDLQAGEEESEDSGQEEETDDVHKRLSSSQRKTRKIAAQAEEIALQQKRIEELERRLESESKAPEFGERPKEADFDDFAEYEAALQEWNTRKVFREETHSTKKADTESELNRARNEREAMLKRQFTEREHAAVESGTMPDYRQKVDSLLDGLDRYKVDVPKHVIELVQRSERGPEILYTMASDGKFLDSMLSSDPISAALEIGRREARFSEVKPRTTTKAPPPAKPLRGGGDAGRRTPDEMSVSELSDYLDLKPK